MVAAGPVVPASVPRWFNAGDDRIIESDAAGIRSAIRERWAVMKKGEISSVTNNQEEPQ